MNACEGEGYNFFFKENKKLKIIIDKTGGEKVEVCRSHIYIGKH